MMSSLRRHTLTFQRSGYPTFVDGRPTLPAAAQIVAKGSWQSPTGDILKLFPEGRKVNNVKVFYTSTFLQTADEAQGLVADYTTYLGVQYTVFMVKPWQNGVLPHYCVILENT